MLDHKKINSCLPCGLHQPARNTYFDGKLLTSRDFQAEQDYNRGHRNMHNALLHGTGVVCGLKLVQHPTESCRDKFMVLEPGMALDCCGQEIVVPERVLVKVADATNPETNPDLAEALNGETHLFVAIRRCDEGAEPLPVLLPGCDGESGATEFGRVLEGYEMVFFAQDPAKVTPVTLPTDPNYAWVHSFALEQSLPAAIALNPVENQIIIGEWQQEGEGSFLNIHDAETHDLIGQLPGPSHLGDIVISNSLGLIMASGRGWQSSVEEGIGVWRFADIADGQPPHYIIPHQSLVPPRLALSPTSGTLFVLGQFRSNRSQLLSYSSEKIGKIEDQSGADTLSHDERLNFQNSEYQNLEGPFARQASMMKFSPDGRFLAITAPAVGGLNGLYLVQVSAFAAGGLTVGKARPIGSDIAESEAVHLVDWSLDSQILYVTTQDGDAARIRRFAMIGDGSNIEPKGRGIRYIGRPLDMVIAPTETQAYLLLRDSDGVTRFVAIPIEQIKDQSEPEPETPTLPDDAIRIDGDGYSMALTVHGDRMFVAAADSNPVDQPARSLVAVIDITESQCDAIFGQATDGCASCADTSIETPDHAVILGHLPKYIAGQELKISDADNASIEHIAIDYTTYRTIVPSATKLREVIECMLARGVAEGPPGPRGEPGLQGNDGPTGLQGLSGEDGADGGQGLQGEQGLQGIPGQNGSDGGRGIQGPRGVEGPRGPAGADGGTFDVNSITGVSWLHDETLNRQATNNFGNLLTEIGLAFQFKEPVRFQAFTNSGKTTGPTMLIEIQRHVNNGSTYTWQGIDQLEIAAIENINPSGDTRITGWDEISSLNQLNDPVNGVVIRRVGPGLKFSPGEIVRIVFYTDFVSDQDEPPLDGSHFGGKLPTGNGLPGSTFRSWLNMSPVEDDLG
jgi:hypothetical protein